MKHDIKHLTESFIKALEGKDIDTIENIFADDILFEDVPMGTYKGKVAALNKLTDFFSKAVSIKWDIERFAWQNNLAFVERTNHITLGDKNIKLPMVMVLEFNEQGKISLFRDYFDLKTLEKQFA